MKTEIICITDRSGSMSSIRSDAEGGFNQFIEDQKKVAGEARVTSVVFDNVVETQYEARPLQNVGKFTLEPRGTTALLDAIGMTLNTQAARIKAEGWADKVIVIIVTDGHENASREYTRERIKEMIEHAEKNGWVFVFLAANQDGFSTGNTLGVGKFSGVTGQSFAATSVGTRSMYDSVSAQTANLRADPKKKNT